MHDKDHTDEPPLVSNRVMDIVVALLFLAGSALVIYDTTTKLGVGWTEGEGPSAGYFPFYIAVFMGLASLVTLAQALMRRISGGSEPFVSIPAIGRVLSVLVPTAVFVALIGGISVGPVEIPGIGIYVASAIFIACFMLVFGRAHILKALAVGASVPLALFFLFEKWFLVPLPKGPIEAMLGY